MSDTIASLETAGSHLMMVKYMIISGGALAVYDYLLTFDDEVSYVWQRKKSWAPCLFIANRYLLLFYALFDEFLSLTMLNRGNGPQQHAQCERDIFPAAIIGVVLLLFSDIFITLRVYAIAGQNKLIALYLSTLTCAKLVISFYFLSGLNPNPLFPDIPIDAFRVCTVTGSFHLQITPYAIGVVLDVSAFAVIIWTTYSNVRTVKFSSLVRTVVRDATVYFIMVMVIQTAVLLFLSFADVTISQFPTILYSFLIPILINRLFLSLRRAADVNSTANRSLPFSSVKFGPMSTEMTSEAAVSRPPNDPVETLLDTGDCIPLDELAQHTKSRSLAGRLSVAS